MSVDTNPRASSRSIYDDSGGWSPGVSHFNVEWRGVLGSARFAKSRHRICELRASTRKRSWAAKSPMREALSGICNVLQLTFLEARLGVHKSLLKIRRLFK